MATPTKLTIGTLDPPYAVQLIDGDGSVPDLTGAAVQFHLRAVGSTVDKVDAAADIDDASNGFVSYDWQSGDLDTFGLFEVYWVVTYPGDIIVNYPSDNVDLIEVVSGPNLGYALQGSCSPWTTIEAVRVTCGSFPASGSPQYPSDELIQTEINVATDLLYTLSGQQFTGECVSVVRPCSTRNCYANAPQFISSWPGGGDPSNYDASVCGCSRLHTVDLGAWPVTNIVYVKIDGAIVDPTTYRLDGNRHLVRLAEGSDFHNDGWPTCQRLDRASTEVDTFEVMFEYGISPPPAGVGAATHLACELTKAALGLPCGIPGRATSVNRQQISFTMINASMLDNGLTGLWDVDLFLMSYNPSKSRGQTAVWSPDLQRGSYKPGR